MLVLNPQGLIQVRVGVSALPLSCLHLKLFKCLMMSKFQGSGEIIFFKFSVAPKKLNFV